MAFEKLESAVLKSNDITVTAFTDPRRLGEDVTDTQAAHATVPNTLVDVNPLHSVACERTSITLEEVDYDTLETGAMRNFYSELSEQICHQLHQISSELYSKRLIELPTLEQALELSGEFVQVKAVKVLNAVVTKVKSSPNLFTLFIRILEKCGFEEIAERMKSSYEELKASICRPTPVGNSDSELVKDVETPMDTNHTSSREALSGVKVTKSNLRRGESLPATKSSRRPPLSASPMRSYNSTLRQQYSIDADESDEQMGEMPDHKTLQQQVLQLNIEVLKLKKLNRKLKKKVHEHEATISILDNENTWLVAKVKNLEVQNSILLHQQSLDSTGCELSQVTEEETDHPEILKFWVGCQSCYKKGNIWCRETVV